MSHLRLGVGALCVRNLWLTGLGRLALKVTDVEVQMLLLRAVREVRVIVLGYPEAPK